ncbi:ALP1-like protein isoform X1 [Tanacetum coccineum]|uniref:ALP1-like protein isoform X1 n=1 Tax=Tanacetum coccineum TaxID=301880 RepID=A0ABQ5CE33_9ASTR
MANCCGILEEPVCLRVDKEVKYQTEALRELRGTRETIEFELQAYGTAVLRGRMDPSNMMRAVNRWTEAMEHRPDAVGGMSIHPIMKCTSAIRQLAYGYAPDVLDEYLQIAGANNDLNVLHRSNLFDDVLDDLAPECPFTVNGHTYNRGYYLAGGIYPTWSAFVKSYSIARTQKDLNFKQAQESARKDIERAFSVLQSR